MARQLTQDDAEIFARSVTNIETTIYPDVYKQDKKIFDVVERYANCVVSSIDRYTEYTFNISVREFLNLVEENIGLSKWVKEFKSKYDDESLQDSFDELTDAYSSVELVWLYNFFPNLSYIEFHVVRGSDMRVCRDVKSTVLSLPDVSISCISLNLREIYPQTIVDRINKYAIENGVVDDNVMCRDVAMSFDAVGEMFKTFSELAIDEQDEELYHMLYDPISIYDISELLNDTSVVIITDYPTI